jgi:hypothetical protein
MGLTDEKVVVIGCCDADWEDCERRGATNWPPANFLGMT